MRQETGGAMKHQAPNFKRVLVCVAIGRNDHSFDQHRRETKAGLQIEGWSFSGAWCLDVGVLPLTGFTENREEQRFPSPKT